MRTGLRRWLLGGFSFLKYGKQLLFLFLVIIVMLKFKSLFFEMLALLLVGPLCLLFIFSSSISHCCARSSHCWRTDLLIVFSRLRSLRPHPCNLLSVGKLLVDLCQLFRKSLCSLRAGASSALLSISPLHWIFSTAPAASSRKHSLPTLWHDLLQDHLFLLLVSSSAFVLLARASAFATVLICLLLRATLSYVGPFFLKLPLRRCWLPQLDVFLSRFF